MTTSKSIQVNLTSESVETILSELGYNEAGLQVNSLGYNHSGYGHYKITAEICRQDNWRETIDLTVLTSNTHLIDEWGEDSTYFESENAWYDDTEEVMYEAFMMVMSSESNQEKLNEFLNN